MGRVYEHHTLPPSPLPILPPIPYFLSCLAYFLCHGEVGVISQDQLSRNQPSRDQLSRDQLMHTITANYKLSLIIYVLLNALQMKKYAVKCSPDKLMHP